MATKTLGTNGTTTLTAINWSPGTTISATDMATIANSILDDVNVAHPIYPGAFSNNGLLYIPNRGVLKVLPGDWVGVDGAGWPVLVSGNIVATSWTHS